MFAVPQWPCPSFTGIIPQRFVAAALEDQGVVFSDFNNRSVMDVQWVSEIGSEQCGRV